MKQFEGHTPGPWEWERDSKGNYTDIIGPNYCPVAEADDLGGQPYVTPVIDIYEANAKLIAAAPDLLAERDQYREALKLVFPVIEAANCVDDPTHSYCMTCRARDAIHEALKGDTDANVQ